MISIDISNHTPNYPLKFWYNDARKKCWVNYSSGQQSQPQHCEELEDFFEFIENQIGNEFTSVEWSHLETEIEPFITDRKETTFTIADKKLISHH
jgi:hypothetical protein